MLSVSVHVDGMLVLDVAKTSWACAFCRGKEIAKGAPKGAGTVFIVNLFVSESFVYLNKEFNCIIRNAIVCNMLYIYIYIY